MQLNTIGKAIRPLTLIAGMAISSPSMYADIDQYSAITSVLTNHRTESYLRLMDNREEKSQRIERRFRAHLEAWKRETMFTSSPKAIVENEDFRAIVSMGYDAVPYILDSIEQEPSLLVWALNFIYGAKISRDTNVTVTEACKLWVKKLNS